MQVYIMTDVEGVAGVQDSVNWCLPSSRYLEKARELLTLEVNAAVEGFLAAGADGILVADGHGPGGILPDLLHQAAELARNWTAGKPYPFSLDVRRFDFAAWIGQHPKAGTVRGHICHTGSMSVRDLSVNGVSMGEFGEVALCAGELGVRSILATGCEAFTAEARDLVPGIETVAVKKGTQTAPGHNLPEAAYRLHNTGAVHLSPRDARHRIRAGAQRALERAQKEDFGLLKWKPPYERVTVFRSSEFEPPRIRRDKHPDSVIALLNQSNPLAPLDLDPMQCEAVR
jgi:D-amino peptidase